VSWVVLGIAVPPCELFSALRSEATTLTSADPFRGKIEVGHSREARPRGLAGSVILKDGDTPRTEKLAASK